MANLKGLGAPKGNDNNTKNKPWAEALRREVIQDPERLRRIARKTCKMAEEGDLQAIKEIGDRLDGKPHQTIAADINGTVEVVELQRFAGKK